MIQAEQQTSPPLTIGCSTQLLLDDHVVDDAWNIRRSPELPVKYLGNPIIDSHPVVGDCSVVCQSVMYDEEERLFKLWSTLVDTNLDTFPSGYHQDSVHSYMYRGAYSVSQDGLDWECPDLGIIEYRGSTANNLFQSEGCGFVLKDGHESDPSRRYKMLTKRTNPGGRVFAAFSPDGVHWADHPGGPVLPNSRDGANSFLYDERLGKYVLFCRPTVLPLDFSYDPDELGFPDRNVFIDDFHTGDKFECKDRTSRPRFPDESDYVMRWETEDYVHRHLKVFPYTPMRSLRISQGRSRYIGCNRRIARSVSDDFVHWSLPEVVIRPDELDPPRLYNMDVTRYEGLYIGLLQVFHSWGTRRLPGTPDEPETFDLHLAFSRDGIRWERLANRPVFLERGYVGDFDGGMISGAHVPLIPYGDELRIYYTGHVGCHNLSPASPSSKHAIGVARLPRGRLVARTAGDELGVLMTKPFVVEGRRLHVNADTRRGLLKAEVVTAGGEKIPGYTCSECHGITGNGFELPISWSRRSDLQELAGQTVRLRFYLREARLYSFRLRGGRPS